MPVAQSAASALQQDDFLSVFGDVADVLARLGVVHHSSTGHFDNLVLAVLAEAAVLRSAFAVSGHDVAVVAQVKQGPVVAVSAQDDVSAASAIATVGTSVGHVLGTAHVCGAPSALARAAIYLYVIYKVRFCHNVSILMIIIYLTGIGFHLFLYVGLHFFPGGLYEHLGHQLRVGILEIG